MSGCSITFICENHIQICVDFDQNIDLPRRHEFWNYDVPHIQCRTMKCSKSSLFGVYNYARNNDHFICNIVFQYHFCNRILWTSDQLLFPTNRNVLEKLCLIWWQKQNRLTMVIHADSIVNLYCGHLLSWTYGNNLEPYISTSAKTKQQTKRLMDL